MENLIFRIWENADLEMIFLELKELENTIEFEEVNSQLVFIKKGEILVGTLEFKDNMYYFNKL